METITAKDTVVMLECDADVEYQALWRIAYVHLQAIICTIPQLNAFHWKNALEIFRILCGTLIDQPTTSTTQSDFQK